MAKFYTLFSAARGNRRWVMDYRPGDYWLNQLPASIETGPWETADEAWAAVELLREKLPDRRLRFKEKTPWGISEYYA